MDGKGIAKGKCFFRNRTRIFRFLGILFDILFLKKFIGCGLMDLNVALGMNAPREKAQKWLNIKKNLDIPTRASRNHEGKIPILSAVTLRVALPNKNI